MMPEQVFTLETLFEQLGMSADPDDIERFISEHRLPGNVPLHEAEYWTPQQAAFLKDELDNDADWAEVIDELNARLH